MGANKKVKGTRKSGIRPQHAPLIDRVIAGTDEKADEFLRTLDGYDTIPGVNAMTFSMIANFAKKLSGRADIQEKVIRQSAHYCGVRHNGLYGQWEPRHRNTVNIRKAMEKAGLDVTLPQGMALCGVSPQNSRLNLYSPKYILAILMSNPYVRRVIGERVSGLYPFVPEPAPEPEVTATLAPGFMQLIQAYVQEAVKEAMQQMSVVN